MQNLISKNIEQAFVASLLIRNDKFLEVYDLVKPHMLQSEKFKLIIEVLYERLDKNKTADLPIIADAVTSRGGKCSVKSLTGLFSHGNSDMIKEYALQIRDAFLKTKLVDMSIELSRGLSDGNDPVKELTTFNSSTEKLLTGIHKSEDSHVSENIFKLLDEIGTPKKEGQVVGIPTGWLDLDRMFGGLKRGKFGVIAGRPAMGKTYLSAGIVYGAAKQLKKGEIISIYLLEQTKEEFTTILLSYETGISVDVLSNSRYISQTDSKKEKDRKFKLLFDATSKIADLPIHIEDKIYDLDKIVIDMRLKNRKHNVRISVIDYLQLMEVSRHKNDTMENATSKLSRKLKQLSMPGGCDCTVIALSQLSRQVESRGGSKKPMLSDLRNSGAIEQDADWVLFPYRPEYYGFNEDGDGSSLKGIAELIIAKNRGGQTGTLIKKFKDGLFTNSDPTFTGLDQPNGVDKSWVESGFEGEKDEPVPF